jgi:GNAT superfamily N-acetyltransferase
LRIALDQSEQDVEKAVGEGLQAFNASVVGLSEAVPIIVSVRDDDGAIKGGIVGRVWLDTLYLSHVWIDDTLRGKGHGKAMMDVAEAEGRKHGAIQSWLNTLSWQARPFYESLGYSCFGEMPMVHGKHRRYFLRKDL